MAKQPTPSAADAAPKPSPFRASLSKAERAQVEAAMDANAEPHEVYAALRICLLSSPGDLESTVKPEAARAMVADAVKQLG